MRGKKCEHIGSESGNLVYVVNIGGESVGSVHDHRGGSVGRAVCNHSVGASGGSGRCCIFDGVRSKSGAHAMDTVE